MGDILTPADVKKNSWLTYEVYLKEKHLHDVLNSNAWSQKELNCFVKLDMGTEQRGVEGGLEMIATNVNCCKKKKSKTKGGSTPYMCL
jgi:hypothetical protein